MATENRFDVIVNDGDVYEQALDLPQEQLVRAEYDRVLEESLADAAAGTVEEVHFKAVTPAETRGDTIQKVMFHEESIIKYLADHEYPQRIRVICPDDGLATQYQMNYNFYYATEKSDRLGIEKWD